MAQKDIYGHEAKAAEGWVLSGVVVQIDGAEDIVITSITVNYPRQIMKFSPLNAAKRIFIAGEGNGTMQLGTVLGPTSSVKDFIAIYGDTCNLANNKPIILSPGRITDCNTDNVSTPSDLSFVCSGCMLQGINLSIQKLSQDAAMLQAGLSMSFNSLKIN